MSGTQAPHPIALTAAGKRLADALNTNGVVVRGRATLADDLNAAAEILMPAEGAGLREAVTAEMEAAALTAFYGSQDWRAPKRTKQYEKSARSDMRRALFAATAVSEPGRGPAAGVGVEPLTVGWFRDLFAEPLWNVPHWQRDVLMVVAVLASPQSAVEGPVAAGVDDAAYEAAWNEYRWMGGPGYTDSSASTAFLEGWNAARALTPPADPKPTVPGNDAGMREALDEINVHEEAENYELRADGDYIPNEFEKSLLEDFGAGLMGKVYAALAPQTGSAEEDPKTPDAGVGDEVEKYAEESYQIGKRDGYEEGVQDAALRVGLDGEYTASSDPERHVPNAPTMLDRIQERYEAVEARAAQPAPVGEDETGVREAKAWPAGYQETFDAIAKAVTAHGAGDIGISVKTFYRALAYPDALQPPKAETPAGVGYYEALQACGERYRGMQVEAGVPAYDATWKFTMEFTAGVRDRLPLMKLNRWLGYIQAVLIRKGFTTVDAERDWTRPLFRPLDFQPEISAAPASRPGDGFVLVPREPTEEMLKAGMKAADKKWMAWTGGRSPLDGMWFFVRDAYPAMLAAAPGALANQPPKADTPAGVGEDGSMPPAAYFFAVDKWGSTWVTNEFASLREFAALSAAPAARPGDEVSGLRAALQPSHPAEAAAPSGSVGDLSGWKCGSRHNTGANDPQDCGWPTCGCDPYADKVIAALEEAGILTAQQPALQAPVANPRALPVMGNQAHADRALSAGDEFFMVGDAPGTVRRLGKPVAAAPAADGGRG